MAWIVEYFSCGKWFIWKTVKSKKAAESVVASRTNLTSICRVRKSRKRVQAALDHVRGKN
jgi:hypothetical protein